MAKSRLTHIATRVFGRPLLIAQRDLDALLQVIGPRMGVAVPDKVLLDEDDSTDPVSDKPYVVTDDGIAIIRIAGTLVRQSSWMDALCGLTSYAKIDGQIRSAVEDDSIQGILLDIDSPGGECAGCFDLADRIYSLRGKKPMYAIANEDMFSAAYAIGSCADKIFLSRTAGVGSVGVICLHIDQSGFDQKEGLKYTALFAGDRKNDFSPHEPLASEALDREMDEINRLYGMFVSQVARNRGLSESSVRATQAGVFFGPGAIQAGLADQIGTFSDALTALGAVVQPIAQQTLLPIFTTAGASAAANSTKEATIMPDTNVADPLVPPSPAAALAPPSPTAAPVAQPSFYSDADIDEIDDLCVMAGKSMEDARNFRALRLKPSQVRRALMEDRTTRMAASQINGAVSPASSTVSEQSEMSTNPDKNPVVEAATRMARGHQLPPAGTLARVAWQERGIQ